MLADTVRQAGRVFGKRSFQIAPSGWAMSYEQLNRWSDEVAVGLAQRGVRESSVVALVLPTCPEYTVLYAACAKLGALTAGVNHRLTQVERERVLTTVQPDLILSTPELMESKEATELIRPSIATSPSLASPEADQIEAEVLAELRVPDGSPASLTEDLDRPICIVFTSGTTGTPKGAVFGGRQLQFICHVDTQHMWNSPQEPAVDSSAGTSLTHLGPMTKLLGNLHRGGTSHLMKKWTALGELEATEQFRMPVIAGIPTQLALILHHKSFDEFDLSCVQAVIIGGGPATPALISEARERLGVPVAVRYACTEAGIGVGTSFQDPPEDALQSVGRPHSGVELTVRSEAGELLELGEIGEIALKSPAVTSGYYNDPDATAAAFCSDGAVRTGDLGHLDESGRLHLVGRAKEMYIRGGYNVYPMEVEAVLSQHADVAEVVIVPRLDPIMGEIGVAVLVPRDPLHPPTLEALRSFAGEQIAPFKLPSELLIRDSLPLTPMEKIDRKAIREEL